MDQGFIGSGLPAVPIHAVDEVFDDAQVQHRQIVEMLEHPVLGEPHQVVTPISNFASEVQYSSLLSHLPPPDLGEPTCDVLRRLGFDLATIRSMCNSGVTYQSHRPPATVASEKAVGAL